MDGQNVEMPNELIGRFSAIDGGGASIEKLLAARAAAESLEFDQNEVELADIRSRTLELTLMAENALSTAQLNLITPSLLSGLGSAASQVATTMSADPIDLATASTVVDSLARIFRSGVCWSHENALRPGMIGVAEHQPNPEGGGRFHVST